MMNVPAKSPLPLIAVLLVASSLIAFVRVSGLPDLMDNEQQRQAAYILDARQNQHWLCQKDNVGEITSKPPLYTWLALLTTAPFARINRIGTTLPAILATMGVVCLVYLMGRKVLGDAAAFWAGWIYLFCAPTARQIGLARMDSLLPLTVALGAWAAWHVWQTGRGWIFFGLAAVASTLAKSPHAAAISAFGLLAIFWENRTGYSARLPLRGLRLAMLIVLLLTGGWLLFSIKELGPAVYQKLIFEEFIDHAIQPHTGKWPLMHFYMPPLQVMERWAPWSALLCIALWRVIARPASEPSARRFERFLACWFGAGLLLFCIPSHERADFLWPLYPAAALLAGREMVMLLAHVPAGWLRPVYAVVAIGIGSVGITLAAWKYHSFADNQPDVIHTIAIRDFAQRIEARVGDDFPLTHVDAPFAVNFYLNTMRPLAYGPTKKTTGFYDVPLNATYDYENAARLLKSDAAAFVIVGQLDELRKFYPDIEKNLTQLDAPRYPHLKERHNDVRLLSNRPALQYYDDMIAGIGALRIRTHNLSWQHAAEHNFSFTGPGSVTLTNQGGERMVAEVVLNGQPGIAITLDPGQVAQVAP